LAVPVSLVALYRLSHHGGPQCHRHRADIAGKYFGVPTYQLFGGAPRQGCVHYHVLGDTKENVQGCIDARKQGFTAGVI
jgi:hypothetical protein